MLDLLDLLDDINAYASNLPPPLFCIKLHAYTRNPSNISNISNPTQYVALRGDTWLYIHLCGLNYFLTLVKIVRFSKDGSMLIRVKDVDMFHKCVDSPAIATVLCHEMMLSCRVVVSFLMLQYFINL